VVITGVLSLSVKWLGEVVLRENICYKTATKLLQIDPSLGASGGSFVFAKLAPERGFEPRTLRLTELPWV